MAQQGRSFVARTAKKRLSERARFGMMPVTSQKESREVLNESGRTNPARFPKKSHKQLPASLQQRRFS
jgi:hypothetical protein